MNQTFVSMNEQYRGLNLYGGYEPISETLLGPVTQWKPTGCVAFKQSNGVISELTGFRFPMPCDDEEVAKCFGLGDCSANPGRKLPGFSDSPL
jgi:hypothetical protein